MRRLLEAGLSGDDAVKAIKKARRAIRL
jgi:hypothetical protein